MMKIQTRAIATAALLCSLAMAGHAQQNAALTPFGAEKAGNAAKTIPPYEGGVKAPEGFKRNALERPDPFASDKILYTVTAANLSQYAGMLTPGTQAMLKQYPDTFKVNVYPTHRSVWYPDWVLENTAKNATRCKTMGANSDGLGGEGCRLGIAFPTPKTGAEAMWNHQTRFLAVSWEGKLQNWLGSANGNLTLATEYDTYADYPFYDQKTAEPKNYYRFKGIAINPPREAGTGNMAIYPMAFDKDDQRFYSYTPGQRRVRLAPEFSYDTPNAAMGGVMFYDEVSMFSGRMDRFDFKLQGKKEMLIPYNNFKMYNAGIDNVLDKFHLKSDVTRWELHRVWVVESTLKPGQRHAYKKRTFYLDEDTWQIVAYDGYDQSDTLYRTGLAYPIPFYETGGSTIVGLTITVLPTRQWTLSTFTGKPGYIRPKETRQPDSALTPESLAGGGIR